MARYKLLNSVNWTESFFFPSFEFKSRLKKKSHLAFLLIIVFIVVLSLIIYYSLSKNSNELKSKVGYYSKAAIATDNPKCSTVGRELLEMGGSAADAAISSIMCACLHNFQSCGIGGGFFMIIYDRPRNFSGPRQMKTFDAREVAPLNSSRGMYHTLQQTKTGGLSIAVPGEVKGYYEVWQEFGRLPWKKIFEPIIKFCSEGFEISSFMGKAIQIKEKLMKSDPSFRELFVKPDGSLLKEGDFVKMPKLASTLKMISLDPHSFYHGNLRDLLLEDLKEAGSIITKEDFESFKVNKNALYSEVIPGISLTLHSLKPPSSGPILSLILKVFSKLGLKPSDLSSTESKVEMYHKIIETLKFAIAARTYLGDPAFTDIDKVLKNITSEEFVENIVSKINPFQTHPPSFYNPELSESFQDQGTSHLSLISEEGGVVAITSTINYKFGSCVLGKRSGVLFNNEIFDFSIPLPSSKNLTSFGRQNYLQPGKRPMSSMIPTIFTDFNREPKLVIGASGGTAILTSVSITLAHFFFMGFPLDEAIDSKRFHINFEKNRFEYETGFDKEVLDGLKKKGHEIFEVNTRSLISVVQGVAVTCDPQNFLLKNCFTAVSDKSKNGAPDGF